MILSLRRDTSSPDCIVGVLSIGDKKIHTIEPPWVPNPAGGKAGAPFVSCLPAGTYRLEPFKLPSGERGYVVSNPQMDVYKTPFEVPKPRKEACRSRVTIRAANYAFDAVDAIGVGLQRLKTQQGWKLEKSIDALNVIRTTLNGTLDLTLVIEDGGASIA